MTLDLNMVVLRGRLVAEPEYRVFEKGSRLIRYLVLTRTDVPIRRIDVIPVTLWNPTECQWAATVEGDAPIWAVGTLQRRFSDGTGGRQSRIEIVAIQVFTGQAGEWADAPAASVGCGSIVGHP